MVDVFSQMGEGKSFSVAFEAATGIELVDFYAMFEEARPALGIAIGSIAAPAPAPSPSPSPSPSPTPTPSTGQVKFTLDEVKKHSSSADCWTVVDGSVYNLTKWVALHPGGPAIIQSLCGRDGTSDFLGRHANQPDPVSTLTSYFIGKLNN